MFSDDFLSPDIRCNSMEGFWSFVRHAWYGSHHHYSTKYTPLYLAEACNKYNYRGTNIFAKFLAESIETG
ncbi:transposase [Candidatus Poribacteria bacterium]|nr:transposase [Candidatus Poribacteria bacterium]